VGKNSPKISQKKLVPVDSQDDQDQFSDEPWLPDAEAKIWNAQGPRCEVKNPWSVYGCDTPSKLGDMIGIFSILGGMAINYQVTMAINDFNYHR